MHGFQWWMLMPFVAMGFGFFGMWLKHKRRVAELELLKSYIDRGMEPPKELLEVLKDNSDSSQATSADAWKSATSFAAISIGFGAAFFLAPGRAGPFLIVSLVMGVLALGWFGTAWRRSKQDKQ